MKAVLFDFFGVICDERLWQWLHANIPDTDKRADYFHQLADKADQGGISKDGLYETLGAEAGKSTEEVKREVYDEIRLHQDVLGIMKRLHKHYKVGILTNADNSEIEDIVHRYALTGYFDGLVVSSAVGLIKPNPEIFELACERLGVQPEETVFIDDNQVNVDGAERAGLKGILFQDAKNLEQGLGQLGIQT